MTQIEMTRPVQSPALHGRRSSGVTGFGVPRVVWPIVAMVLMIPVLAVLLIALFT